MGWNPNDAIYSIGWTSDATGNTALSQLQGLLNNNNPPAYFKSLQNLLCQKPGSWQFTLRDKADNGMIIIVNFLYDVLLTLFCQ